MKRGKTGKYHVTSVGGEQVRAFVPAPLPPVPPLAFEGDLQKALEAAVLAVGRLDGVSALLPDKALFLYAYVRKEAVLSSQIEGTQSSLSDLLLFELDEAPGVPLDDVVEVSNYVAALEHGLARLREGFPLSNRLIREIHGVLLSRGRGSGKDPGEFRRSQNWIGGASPMTARFVPPPWEEVGPTFSQLERYLHDEAPVAPLVKIGLVHAQFETIHPFLDGNGRIGRLLITFWLMQQGILRRPLLYPSLFFKEHRVEYIDRLQAIRDRGDWEGWLAFFVEGIGVATREAADRALDIVRLREEDRARIAASSGRRSPNAHALLDRLYEFPLVSAKRVQDLVDVSQPTAGALLKDLTRVGILREVTGRRRDRLFAYDRYLALFPNAEDRG